VGQPSQDSNKTNLKAFNLPVDSLCVFLTLKVTEPSVAQTKFEEILKNLILMAEALTSPEMYEQLK
jgi:hypothetical protein